MGIQTVKDLNVYNEAFNLAMTVFSECKSFPNSEKYSLTSQIIRYSRSIAANIREGYTKRADEQIFARHLIDALGSSEETRCWLDFALSCGYINAEKHSELDKSYAKLSAMIFALRKNWKPLNPKR